jgi:MFS family permease
MLAAGLFGLIALGIARRVEAPQAAAVVRRQARSSDGQVSGLVRHLVEPSALPGTAMLVAFGSTTTLFSIFAPVFVAAQGGGLEALVLYYPLYGLAQVVALPIGGRVGDRIGRERSIVLGTVIATAALALAVGGGLAGFTLGAITYAVASALVNPAVNAMTIERAPEGRLGSAIATYSIGYQVANGLSAVAWGALISVVGYPWPFIVAAGCQLATVGLSRRAFQARVPGSVVSIPGSA